jgi:DNA-binding MltR family transcriptional regulator
MLLQSTGSKLEGDPTENSMANVNNPSKDPEPGLPRDVTAMVQEERGKSASRGLDEKLTEAERAAFYDHASERAMAVVLAAIIENHLTDLLRLLMRREEDIARELFHPSGPLGPFGTKIRLAYMLRIIGPEQYRDLIVVNKIRNKFAHDLNVVSFENPPVRDWLENMHICGIVKKMATEARERMDKGTSVDQAKDFIAGSFIDSATDMYRACLRFLIHQIVDQETGIRAAEAKMNNKP